VPTATVPTWSTKSCRTWCLATSRRGTRLPNLTIRATSHRKPRGCSTATTANGVLPADGTEYQGREVIPLRARYGSQAILLRSGIGPAADLISTWASRHRPTCPSGPMALQDQVCLLQLLALAPATWR